MRAGEYGVTLEVDTGFDLSGCTAMKLRWLPPGRRQRAVERRITPAPSSGTTFTYVTQAADFPDPGLYLLMLEADFGASKRLRSADATLELERPIGAETDS